MFSRCTGTGMVRTALTGLFPILPNESVNYVIIGESYVEPKLHHVPAWNNRTMRVRSNPAAGL